MQFVKAIHPGINTIIERFSNIAVVTNGKPLQHKTVIEIRNNIAAKVNVSSDVHALDIQGGSDDICVVLHNYIRIAFIGNFKTITLVMNDPDSTIHMETRYNTEQTKVYLIGECIGLTFTGDNSVIMLDESLPMLRLQGADIRLAATRLVKIDRLIYDECPNLTIDGDTVSFGK